MCSHVIHPIPPVFSAQSEILLLGTMPSPASRTAGFFYMHPQNRFWRVMELLSGEAFACKNGDGERAVEERKDFILRHRLALWDVLASCDIKGAGDASIKNACPNNLEEVLSAAPIKKILCTGKMAFTYCQRFFSATVALPIICLPSTSPANQGRWPLEKLLEAYRAELASIM